MKSELLNYEVSLNSNPEVYDIINEIKSEQTLILKKMVHEINNILCLINSSLQIIEASHPETKDFKYWNTTIGNVDHLINLISDISSLNYCENIRFESVDIKLLISNIINSFISNNKYSNVSFKLECDKDIPIIKADKTKLKQVFINIIKNALEAFNENSINALVHIYISFFNETIQVSINDNGCGISPKHIETIFNPMISYKSGGSGLGLPISKKIIEAHNGTITVHSALNVGTTFNISLPID